MHFLAIFIVRKFAFYFHSKLGLNYFGRLINSLYQDFHVTTEWQHWNH